MVSNSAFQQALAPALVLTVWFLPLYAIALDNRVQHKEKILWLAACLFVSWPAWILYHFIAPLTCSGQAISSGSAGSMLDRTLAFYTRLACKVRPYQWLFVCILALASISPMVAAMLPGLESVVLLMVSWSAFFLVLWSVFPTSRIEKQPGLIEQWPSATSAALVAGHAMLVFATAITAILLLFGGRGP